MKNTKRQPRKNQLNNHNLTTRLQLQGYGLSPYQTRVVTKNLTPVGKHGRAYAYTLTDVIASIKYYLQNRRIKLTTKHSLEAVLAELLKRLNNVVEVPFGSATNPEINKLAKQLAKTMSDTDSALAELRATAATIKGKYNI